MRNKSIVFVSAVSLAALLMCATGATAQLTQNPGKDYKPPRTADGHPDLNGTYDLATITPLIRPSGFNRTLTDEQAAKMEAQMEKEKEQGDAPLAADRAAPPKGNGDQDIPARYRPATGGTGGYNSGWIDPGSTVNVVNGEKRSSIIVDPPDGKVPAMTQEGSQRGSALRNRPRSEERENRDAALDRAPGAFDDPEIRPLSERCILGFGSTSGPPMLPDYFYNNLHQIVQTPTSIMILSEMVHDARIVRMNAKHLPNSYRFWMGDSVGHWEGDTLVVDTTNFNDKTRFFGSSEDLHVVERFTRTGPKTLLYQFTIDDPTTWTKPWSGEFTWPTTNEHIYEYACHEGNYAMEDILKGARQREKEQPSAKATNDK
jgi:hypothetical protein